MSENRKRNCEKILRYMKAYFGTHGYMPSLEDIAFDLGWCNPSKVGQYLHDMIKLGMIETDHYEFGRIHARAYRIGRDYL